MTAPATAIRTWVFLADSEGLVDVGDSAALSAGWSATDGNPLGSLEWQTTSITLVSERARKATTDSWETLFSIPTAMSVTHAQVMGWDELNWNSHLLDRRVRMRIVDGSGTTVHSGGDLFDTGTGTTGNITGAPQAKGPGTQRPIIATYQPSSTGVKLEIQVDATSADGLSLDLEQDNIAVQIWYGNASQDTKDFALFPKPKLARV